MKSVRSSIESETARYTSILKMILYKSLNPDLKTVVCHKVLLVSYYETLVMIHCIIILCVCFLFWGVLWPRLVVKCSLLNTELRVLSSNSTGLQCCVLEQDALTPHNLHIILARG